jgi:Tol biopolymer transport system component
MLRSTARLVLAICLVLATAKPGLAQFTLEQVMGAPFSSDLTAAEHGPRVAWTMNIRGVRNIWIAEAPNFTARQLTNYREDDGQPLASLRLTADGRTVLYVRGSEANTSGEVADPTSAGEQRKQQVWAIDVDGSAQPRLLGEMGCDDEGCEDIEISPDGKRAVWATKKQLWIADIQGPASEKGNAKQLAFFRGSNEQPRWSPDGKAIAFVSHRDDHSFIGIYDLEHKTTRWLAPGSNRDTSPRWSPDGRKVAFIRLPGLERHQPLIPERTTPWAIWVADVNSAEGRQIWASGTQENDDFPSLTADGSFYFAAGDRIVFASERDGRNHLYSIGVDGGQPALLTSGDFDVEQVTLSGDKKSVIYTSNQGDTDRRHLWRVPVDGSAGQQQLTSGDTAEWSPAQLADGTIVCLGSSATTPAMPYRIQQNGGNQNGRKMIAAETVSKDFPSNQLVTPQIVTLLAKTGSLSMANYSCLEMLRGNCRR